MFELAPAVLLTPLLLPLRLLNPSKTKYFGFKRFKLVWRVAIVPLTDRRDPRLKRF